MVGLPPATHVFDDFFKKFLKGLPHSKKYSQFLHPYPLPYSSLPNGGGVTPGPHFSIYSFIPILSINRFSRFFYGGNFGGVVFKLRGSSRSLDPFHKLNNSKLLTLFLDGFCKLELPFLCSFLEVGNENLPCSFWKCAASCHHKRNWN